MDTLTVTRSACFTTQDAENKCHTAVPVVLCLNGGRGDIQKRVHLRFQTTFWFCCGGHRCVFFRGVFDEGKYEQRLFIDDVIAQA